MIELTRRQFLQSSAIVGVSAGALTFSHEVWWGFAAREPYGDWGLFVAIKADNETAALDRLRRDDPLWQSTNVRYLGQVSVPSRPHEPIDAYAYDRGWFMRRVSGLEMLQNNWTWNSPEIFV